MPLATYSTVRNQTSKVGVEYKASMDNLFPNPDFSQFRTQKYKSMQDTATQMEGYAPWLPTGNNEIENGWHISWG